MKHSTTTEHYDIGAVCRLTGVNAPNLRMWEKRYSVVEPVRTETGRRLYSAGDLERVKLLKSLVDAGQAIGTIANLPRETLQERLSQHITAGTPKTTEPFTTWPRTLVCVGARATELCLGKQPAFPGTVVKEAFRDLDHSLSDHYGEDCELLLIAIPTLFAQDLKKISQLIERTRANRTLIIYDFSPSTVLNPLLDGPEDITALKAPADVENLRLAWKAHPVAEQLPDDDGSTPPPRRFSNDQLAYLSTLSSALKCECPHHLASLISGLVAFESYSEQCENESEQDARLHTRLGNATARARFIMEEALQELLAIEKIAVK